MRQYLDLLAEVRQRGTPKRDRTGTGTSSLFGRQLRFDLAAGFPALTTKRLHLQSIFHELLWFVRGDTNIGYLRENGVTIWDEWADQNGDLGPVYGAQWRAWEAEGGRRIDQLARVVEEIGTSPDSRRLIVSAWNVGSLERMALPPCHAFFQFYVAGGRLSCQMYQRSADVFLGLPFNIASYALLTHMVAQVTSLEPGELIVSLGDVHLYSNHVAQADLQLARQPLTLPRLVLDPRVKNLFDFEIGHIRLEGYQSHPAIKAPVAV